MTDGSFLLVKTVARGDAIMHKSICAGFGRADITPEQYGPMSGFGTDERRICNQVMDRIQGTCIAISDAGDNTFLLCTADLLNAKAETVVAAAREAITAATGIPDGRIMVAVTHTHSGPATYSREVAFTDAYLDYFGKQLAKAAQDALADRREAEIFIGQRTVRNMTFVRHYLMNDGTYGGSCFGSFKSGAKAHLADADEQLQLIRFQRVGAADIVLLNWQSHSTFIGHPEGTVMSADYAGPLRNHVEGMTGCHFAFFQGACGNLVPHSRIEEENIVENDHIAYGRHLAEEVLEGLKELRPVSGGSVRTVKHMYRAEVDHSDDSKVPDAQYVQAHFYQLQDPKERLALRKKYGFNSIYHANQVINRSRLPASIEMELDALCAGDISFVTLPFEPFCSNGVFIKENSPFEMTFILGYCNGSNSYIADEAAFGYDCYEVNSRRFYQGTAEDIAQTHVKLLKKLKDL